METQTIREAYLDALEAAKRQNVPERQRHMVACLAVKDAMDDTTENMIALRNIMKSKFAAQ